MPAIHEALHHVSQPDFACTFGQMVVKKEQYSLYTYGDMYLPETAEALCCHLYDYIREQEVFRINPEEGLRPEHFVSFIVLFPTFMASDQHDAMRAFCTLLVNMHHFDTKCGYSWAPGVSNDPRSVLFSYSVGGEAFFIPFLHPFAYAPARRAPHTLLVFNAHRLFDTLRFQGKYAAAREAIRNRQLKHHGFIPQLLEDFGEGLEFPQYTLPHHEETDILWQILAEVGGEHPFGKPNGVK